ncbi:MAG: ABC transporter substrate-binding protein, partial [Anaerolineales bacterium]|nr:ABC transporter substrate-binding protein [Anaerolineales bacterium]
MKTVRFFLMIGVVLSLILSACGPAETPEPTAVVTEEPVVTEDPVVTEEPAFSCAEPIKVGLITDASGGLAIYGQMILRSFMLGMEYATGSAGSAGEVYNFSTTQENTFMLGDCQIIVYVADDQSTPDTTATIAREMIEVKGVDILVCT